MPYGYHGRVLRVNLTERSIAVEEPGDLFYRRYVGGRGFIAYTLLQELAPGIDPLGPANRLIFAAGPVTGHPIGGSGRHSVGAKSPLTGGYGDGEAGGFWGAELKRAGFDAIIVEGQADSPVYLWVHDGQAEIADARHLWGQPTAAVEATLRSERGDRQIKVAQAGPAAERLVRFACLINDVNRAAGRTGLGAVMGSKRLKAIAVRGRQAPPLANPEGLKSVAQWLAQNYKTEAAWAFKGGTPGGLMWLHEHGLLPTRNFRQGQFEGAEAISGQTMHQTILVGRANCYACPVRCKQVVEVAEGPYRVDRVYGGPEYETIAAFGSDCGISDLKAIAKANEVCNANGLDTISAGATIAFAMDCFENGLLSTADTDGLELRFGQAEVMLAVLDKIVRREGIGDLLAEGAARAARQIGRGAEELAMHVKGQEIPMHEPRGKQGLGLGYAVSPTGADHMHNIHDTEYTTEARIADVKALGVLEPLAVNDLGPRKVRLFVYETAWRHFTNCALICNFLPYNYARVCDIVNAVTGWETTIWDLMKVGERALNLACLFNAREGFTRADERLPQRFFEPFRSGPLAGQAIDPAALAAAQDTYYQMMGWDPTTAAPTLAKLQELDIAWAAAALPR